MKVIGIDIGGTSIKGIVVNETGEILLSKKMETEASKGRNHILNQLKKVIESLLEVYQEAAGIGIGTAGRVNVTSGEVVYATDNLKEWQGVNLKQYIQDVFHLPVVVDNDANVALIGEWWLGSGKEHQNITMLTLGTGVGGAILINGSIHHGATWSGGEWGHVILYPNGIPCNCGQKGCIEQYLSGTALVRLANEVKNGSYLTGLEIMEDYQNGRKEIIPIVQDYVVHLITVITNIYNILNPESIIIGGGVIESKDIWWDLFEEMRSKSGWAVDVRPATLGNTAGAIGAAKLILNGVINTAQNGCS